MFRLYHSNSCLSHVVCEFHSNRQTANKLPFPLRTSLQSTSFYLVSFVRLGHCTLTVRFSAIKAFPSCCSINDLDLPFSFPQSIWFLLCPATYRAHIIHLTFSDGILSIKVNCVAHCIASMSTQNVCVQCNCTIDEDNNSNMLGSSLFNAHVALKTMTMIMYYTKHTWTLKFCARIAARIKSPFIPHLLFKY